MARGPGSTRGSLCASSRVTICEPQDEQARANHPKPECGTGTRKKQASMPGYHVYLMPRRCQAWHKPGAGVATHRALCYEGPEVRPISAPSCTVTVAGTDRPLVLGAPRVWLSAKQRPRTTATCTSRGRAAPSLPRYSAAAPKRRRGCSADIRSAAGGSRQRGPPR